MDSGDPSPPTPDAGPFPAGEAHYRALFQAALDPVLIYRLGADGPAPFHDVNPAALALYGYRREEMLRLTVSDLVAPDVIHVGEALDRLRRDGHARFASVHLTRGGERIPMDVAAHLVPVEGVTTVLILARDLRADPNDEERATRLAAIVEASHDAITRQTLDGVVTDWSPGAERLYGFTAEEAIGQPIDLIVPDEMREENQLLLAQVRRGEAVHNVETLRCTRDGHALPVLLSLTPLRSPSGRILALATIERDISARKEAERLLARAKEEAEAANRAKSQFLANMSHELRTPLNAVIGYSELLEEEAEDAGYEALLPEVRKIHAAGKQLLSLVNDVLDLSRIEAGKLSLDLTSFHLPGLAEEVATTIAPLAETNGNELRLEIDDGVDEIHADPTKVRQILLNLLGNAAKFTEDGAITLAIEPDRLPVDPDAAPGGEDGLQRAVRLTVRDTGIGMAPDQTANLFTSFYRGEETTAKRYEGTGLGLAITRQLCELMGGTIGVESERGRGSTFTVLLPAVVTLPAFDETDEVDEAPPPATRPPSDPDASPAPDASATDRPVAVVIDDDPFARDLLKRFIEREGYQVFTAPSGAVGIELARERGPAVVVTDVVMPGLGGWDVLAAMKSDPALADIPVIMVTIVENARKAFALGAAEYMTKPVDRQRLTRVLHRLCPTPGACRILMADDDDGARLLLRRMLTSGGYSVVEARNGAEALAKIEHDPPHVLLLDLMMPEMDGFEVIETLRTHPEWRRIPVVVLTAKDLTDAERAFLNGSVDTYLAKSAYSRADLLSEVRTLLDRCRGSS